MKTLVTGAGGFLGRYLAEQLVARGDEVRSLGRGEYAWMDSLGIEQQRGDVRDAAQVDKACQGVEAVYHVAAKAGIWGRWDDYYAINTQGTLNVIEACRKHGVRKLIYTSSPSVTFDGGDQCGVDESVPYPEKFLAHYPHTKALAEQAVLAANDASGSGLLTCALRPHLIWGPRDGHLIPRLLERARRRQLRIVGDGMNLIDTIYVENAARAHLQAADALEPNSPVAGNAYFLSQDEPVNCWQWINELLATFDLPPVTKRISLGMALRAGSVLETVYRLFGWRSEPRMTRFLALQLGTSHYFNIERAKRDFGYRAEILTEEGLRRLLAVEGK